MRYSSSVSNFEIKSWCRFKKQNATIDIIVSNYFSPDNCTKNRARMQSIRSNVPDISGFEKKFREIVYEVQRNSKDLDNFEKERLLIREELCSKELLLQNEQKVSNDLRTRLKMASETINRLEEKMRIQIDYSNLSMNYQSILKEREILTQETLSSRTEVAKLRIKIESLENTLRREIRQKEKLEKLLTDLKTDNEKFITNIDMTIAKLSKEQKFLMESAKSVIQLNRRLQSYGLCSHAINERNKAEIKTLEHKLISLSLNESKQLPVNISNKLQPEIENLCFKMKELLMELKSKSITPAPFEEVLNQLLNELSTNLSEAPKN